MKDVYLNYSLQELVEDPDFNEWAINASNAHAMEYFFNTHPEFIPLAEKSKEAILLLIDLHEEKISEEEKLIMWKQVKDFETIQKKKLSTIYLRKFLKYAAIFLFIILTGISTYLYKFYSQESYHFTSNEYINPEGEAKLVLSTGDEVKLEKDNTSLRISADQKIIINEDQAVDIYERTGKNDLVRLNEVIIPYGKKSELTLDDGTKVWLNAGSRLAFPGQFTGRKREVFLIGEAYFEVAHIADKPFYVNAGDVSVKVLGTRFNISAYQSDNEIVAVLLEGSIALNDNTSKSFLRKETVLEPGQKANFKRDTKSLNINREDDVDFYIAWTEGWFKFYQESLVSVFRKVERYYNVEVDFNSPYHANDLISGKLDLKDSLNDVMLALADVANIEYQITDNKLIITKKRD